ncbi:MAG TPA: acetate--CoA ligase family protein [Humidesulfovibrio sp.]|uniref:acetate--CoA ligase family protein n=1 Tax=Humidesulfovibrio sp. TaxID=2910988 RepID=UPI002CCA8636|nr:acetate--CoA ligase family protein [Humidesulfovibrio sp.]HWR04587.1 acetate--CoA ligase family protein [Humidesulfovibrio sp.]
MDQRALQAFFSPKTVAVIGASATPGKVGNAVVANMLAAGFKGRLYPVNPKGGTIEDLPVTRSLGELPGGIDLAVFAVPRDAVLPAFEYLAAHGLKSAIVLSAGFREAGREGYTLERDLAACARRHGIALLGPNCLGMMNTAHGVNASFSASQPVPGSVAFCSQSGALCQAILDWARGEHFGFSKFISLGNKAVLNETSLLAYLGSDPASKVIMGYMENVDGGEEFVRAAREVSRKKPVIMLKAGSTNAGAKAASSHTGAIAGSDDAYAAAFRQCGIVRAPDLESLFFLAEAFSCLPLPRGPNVAVLSNAGGPGILAADACEKTSLHMARLSPETIQRLQAALPPYASVYNPVDIIGDAGAERYRKSLEAVLDDPLVHAVLLLIAPTAMVEIEATATAIAQAARRSSKPVMTCLLGRAHGSIGRDILRQAGLPCYAFPEPALRSIEAMYAYAQWRQKPVPVFEPPRRDLDAARRILDAATAQGRQELADSQARELAAAYGLRVPATVLARGSAEAVQAAKAMDVPVALKVASAQLTHRTDVGGVALGLLGDEAVGKAFRDLTAHVRRIRPEAVVSGCLVQAMAPAGSLEVVVSMRRDDQFGPLLMFGLGGIHSEILKDVSHHLIPLSRAEAFGMIRSIRSYLLLKGVDGEPAVNFRALEDVLLAMAALAQDFPQVYEAELNPVLVNEEGALVAEARLTLRG